MKLSNTFPAAMRPWVDGSAATWNMSGSVLVYNNPVYTSTWASSTFTGELLSFSSAGLNPYDPGTTAGINTAFGTTHAGAAVAFNSDFTWIAGSQNIVFNIADIATVATHELGHANGLSHPGLSGCANPPTAAENASVMKIVNTGTKRYPAAEDIAYQTWKY